MARKLLVLRPPENRTERLWVAETEADLLHWLRFTYLPELHGLNPRVHIGISHRYEILQSQGNYNFVVQYMLPQEERFWPWFRMATFWLEEVEMAEMTTASAILSGYDVIEGEPLGGA